MLDDDERQIGISRHVVEEVFQRFQPTRRRSDADDVKEPVVRRGGRCRRRWGSFPTAILLSRFHPDNPVRRPWHLAATVESNTSAEIRIS